MNKDVIILAIESSCDETSVAIVKNGNSVLSMSTNTQIKTHAKYGGVIPELASRMHTESILYVYKDALNKSGISMDDIDAIAVTYAPGLMGSLLVGVEFAKTLCYIHKKPLIAVNHLIGHIYANNIDSSLSFPLLAIIVSGGHTEFIKMTDHLSFELLGSTMDDAIGEAFDKVARIMGISYPGGPNLEKLAKKGTLEFNFSKPCLDDTLNLSYSGLKSAVINLKHKYDQNNENIKLENLAYSFQYYAVEQISRKLEIALNKDKYTKVLLAGGVSANKYLQDEVLKVCKKYKVDYSNPEFKYCTDNAAMIGAAAYYQYINNDFSSYSLNALSSKDIID